MKEVFKAQTIYCGQLVNKSDTTCTHTSFPLLGRFWKYSKVLIDSANEVDEEEETKQHLAKSVLLRKGLSESKPKLISYHCRSPSF